MSGAHGPLVAGQAGDPGSPVHRLDARVKVVGAVGVTLVAVSAGLAAWPVWVACGAALAAVAALARVPAAELARRGGPLLAVVAATLVALPFVRPGGAAVQVGPLTAHEAGIAVAVAAAAKALVGALAALLLAATTPPAAVLRALTALRVPALFVLIAQVTLRYLPVVGGEVRRTRTAIAARGYRPRHALQAAAVGRAAGALFVRAHARAERVHLARAARGGNGEAALAPLAPPATAQVVGAVALLGALVALRAALEVAA